MQGVYMIIVYKSIKNIKHDTIQYKYIITFIGNIYLCPRTCDSDCSFTLVTGKQHLIILLPPKALKVVLKLHSKCKGTICFEMWLYCFLFRAH